jgi:hypothetical protein
VIKEQQQIERHLMLAGDIVDQHWDEIKWLLPEDVRHGLGGELGKVRLFREIIERFGPYREEDS